MPSCAVITCRLRSQVSNVNNGGISFHRFPKEDKVREKWINVTGREGWLPKRLSTICSIHFKDHDFEVKELSGNRYLKAGAVPSVKVVCCHAEHKSSKYQVHNEKTRKRNKNLNNKNKLTDKNENNHKNYMQVIVERKSLLARTPKSTSNRNRLFQIMVYLPTND